MDTVDDRHGGHQLQQLGGLLAKEKAEEGRGEGGGRKQVAATVMVETGVMACSRWRSSMRSAEKGLVGPVIKSSIFLVVLPTPMPALVAAVRLWDGGCSLPARMIGRAWW